MGRGGDLGRGEGWQRRTKERSDIAGGGDREI